MKSAFGNLQSVIRLVLGLLLACAVFPAQAQEFNCTVVINSQGVDGIDRRVIDDMKKNLQDFINLRRWTTDTYTPEERINCKLVINITSTSGTSHYVATAQIISSRPVYGTGLETVMVNYLDKDFVFDYVENQSMDFNDNSYSNVLTSLIAYYAYIMLAYDYDSFSKFGGRPYLVKAQQVAANASNSPIKGWSNFDGTTARIMLLENLMNQQLTPYREGFYNYHRLALDNYANKPEQSRAITIDFLKKIQTSLQNKPLCIVINNFLEGKSAELINVLTDASYGDRQTAYNILSVIDPTRTEQYGKLVKQ